MYNGQWYSPLKNALDAFMADTQKFVTGTVRLKFFKGNCHVAGRKSPFSLYDYGLATYDRDTTFDEKASAGFIEIDTLSLKTGQGPGPQLCCRPGLRALPLVSARPIRVIHNGRAGSLPFVMLADTS